MGSNNKIINFLPHGDSIPSLDSPTKTENERSLSKAKESSPIDRDVFLKATIPGIRPKSQLPYGADSPYVTEAAVNRTGGFKTRPYAREIIPPISSDQKRATAILQASLDIIGCIPGFEAADAANGALYASQQDWINAPLSVLALLPLGDVPAKMARIALKTRNAKLARVSLDALKKVDSEAFLATAKRVLGEKNGKRTVDSLAKVKSELARIADDGRKPFKLMPLRVEGILDNPRMVWGHSAPEIVEAFNKAGYHAVISSAEKASSPAVLIHIQNHSKLKTIQVHPGGGIHVGAYYKLTGKKRYSLKVVDPTTYKSSKKDKSQILFFND